jgi:3-dehydroquinate synthase
VNTLHARIEGGSYPIHIGEGLISDSDALRSVLPEDRVLVVTDANVAVLHLPALLGSLGDSVAGTVVLEPGEHSKSLASWEQVVDALAEAGISRDGAVIALGGGVVGDIAGFAAATYLRGIPIIQIPTTLLAQVDASVGGKTAVDHRLGKNLIGAFHQPRAVIADTRTLSTQDDRQYLSAISEILKHAVIADPELFDGLENDPQPLLRRDPETLQAVVSRCCEIKASIVAADEREAGQRAWLNLGHSFGHAIEFASDYATLHGEAIAIGLVLEAGLAAELGRCEQAVHDRIRSLLLEAGLPVAIPGHISAGALLDAMNIDKKRDASGLRLVLPERIGRVSIVQAPDRRALETYLDRVAEPA